MKFERITRIPFISELTNSFSQLRKNIIYLPFAVLTDILFLLVYGFTAGVVMNKILTYIQAIGLNAIKNSAGKSISQLTFSGILSSPETSRYFMKIIFLYLILILIIYLVYSIFSGISWKLSNRIAIEDKISYYNYVKKFAKLNLFWIIFIIVYHPVSLFSSLIRVLSSKTGSNTFPIIFSSLVLLFLVLIAYFMFISYALISSKAKKIISQSFKLGIKKIKCIFPMYLIISLVFLIIELILRFLSENFIFMLIAGIVLAIPAFTWARVYIILTINKVNER